MHFDKTPLTKLSRIIKHNFLSIDQPYGQQLWNWCNSVSGAKYDQIDILKYHTTHPNYGSFVNCDTPSCYTKRKITDNEYRSVDGLSHLDGGIYYSPSMDGEPFYRSPKIILGDSSHQVIKQ